MKIEIEWEDGDTTTARFVCDGREYVLRQRIWGTEFGPVNADHSPKDLPDNRYEVMIGHELLGEMQTPVFEAMQAQAKASLLRDKPVAAFDVLSQEEVDAAYNDDARMHESDDEDDDDE